MARIVPRYIFTVDWDDGNIELPHDHQYAITPAQYDMEYGAQIYDVHTMVGLRGNFTVYDPDGIYDPLQYPEGSTDRERLEFPHRFWHYRIDSDPADTSVRHTGYVILDRRPTKDTAMFKLLPLDFIRLSEQIRVPTFNTYLLDPIPPQITRPTTDRRDSDSAAVESITLIDYNSSFTVANINITYRNWAPTVGGNLDTIYLSVNGADAQSLPVTSSPVATTIDVQPGGLFEIIADISDDFTFAQRLVLQVPTGEVLEPEIVALRVSNVQQTTATVSAQFQRAPNPGEAVFTVNGVEYPAIVRNNSAIANVDGLSPGTNYSVTVELSGTSLSRTETFTTATGTGPAPDPDPDPEPTTLPNIQVISFTTSTASRTVPFAAQVSDLNNTDNPDLTSVQVTVEYRRTGTTSWTRGSIGNPNAQGEYTGTIDFGLQTQVLTYESRAYVDLSSVARSTFSVGQAPVSTRAGELLGVAGLATAWNTGTATARSSPGAAGAIWFRRAPTGTSNWVASPRINRTANQQFTNWTMTGLDALTNYQIQASSVGPVTDSSPDLVSNTFRTPSRPNPCRISAISFALVRETSALVSVTLTGIPGSETETVTLEVAGQTLTGTAQTTFGRGQHQVGFSIAGLTAGTSYSVRASSPNCGELSATLTTASVDMTVIWPEVVRVSAAGFTRTTVTATGQVSLGRDDDGDPFSGDEIVVSWQYRESGTTTWLSAGTSAVLGTTVRATITGLKPITSYTVRARVVRVKGRIQLRTWQSVTIRTGKITRSGINQWRASLADARTALASARELSQSLNRVVTLLRRMDSDAQDVVNAINPGVQVRKLGDVNDSAEELETVAGNLEAQRAELLEDISTYSATTNLAVAALGVGAFGAGGAAIVASTGLIFVGSSAVASFLGAGTLGVTIGAGGTIAIISAAAAAVAAALLIVTLGVAVVLGVKVLNDKAREVQRDVRPLIPQAETARNQFNSSPASPANISEAIRETEAIIAALEQEILRN